MRNQQGIKKEIVSPIKKKENSNFHCQKHKKTCFEAKKMNKKLDSEKYFATFLFFIVECFLGLYSLLIPHYDRTNQRLEPKKGGF